MQKKSGLSIKYKLLSLLILVPVVALGIYTFVAVNLFREDKIAYVFDSSATVSSSLGSQILSEINIYSSWIRPYVSSYQPSQRVFQETVKGDFEEDKNLSYLAVYHPQKIAGSPTWGLGTSLRKKGFKTAGNWIEGETARSIVQSAAAKGMLLRPLGKNTIVFALKNEGQRKEESTVILSILSTGQLQNIFSSQDSFSSYLMDSSGEVFVGSTEQASFQSWSFIKGLKTQSFSNRTIETNSPENKSVIVSYNKLNVGDLIVVSLVEKDKAFTAVRMLLTKSALFFVAILSASFIISILASTKLTSALGNLILGTRKIALGDYNVDINVKSGDEVGELAQSFNLMATEVSRLMSENIEKARMEKELETAKAVQDALFPEASKTIDGINIEGYYTSASECGGDWWHYSDQGDRVFFWIGDATGHGAPAALITSAAKSVASIVEGMPDMTPAGAMRLLNSSIYKNSQGKICMTFFIGSLHKETGEFVYCNASHEPPIMIPDKQGETVKKMDLEPIISQSYSRLGESPASEYEDSKMNLTKGASIYFYTDGVTELMGPDNEMFEERRLLRSIIKGFKKGNGISGAMSQLGEDLEEFRQGVAYEDDVTYFMMSYDGKV